MNLYIMSLILVLVSVSVVFFIAQKKHNNGIIDIYWGLGFFMIAGFGYLTNAHATLVQTITVGLIGLWSLRLSLHLYQRNWKKAEDYRYVELRRQWQSRLSTYVKIFLVQGLLQFLVALPIIHIMSQTNQAITPFTWAGILGFGCGFLFEAVGDYQLKRFVKTKKKDDVMTQGLWSITRHPNYFGNALMWYGVAIIAIGSWSYGWLVLSPILMNVLLVKVSGVPILERRYRGVEAYRIYAGKTSCFIPWIGKKGVLY